MRDIAMSLFNNHDDKDNSINFITEAIEVTNSESIKHKLKQDIKDMNDQ
jgi:hypothetical protein